MRIVECTPGMQGADMVTQLTPSSARALRAAGLDYVVRYLGGLSPGELAVILDAGLGCQLVTYGRVGPRSAAMGAQDGAADLAHLRSLGIPAGMLAWVDLEAAHGAAADVAAWLDARSSAIVQAGYVAGLYVGDSCILDGPQLYARPHVTRYWRAFNSWIPVPQCEWSQIQHAPPNQILAGVQVDRDTAQADLDGRVPMMLVA